MLLHSDFVRRRVGLRGAATVPASSMRSQPSPHFCDALCREQHVADFRASSLLGVPTAAIGNVQCRFGCR